MPELAGIPDLTLKISLDVFDREAFWEMCRQDRFDAVVSAIRAARLAGIRVGINAVLTRDNLPHASALVQFARETGSYLKFLDLNWYVDVGARSTSLPQSDEYWDAHYVSPRRDLLPLLLAEGVRGFELVHPNGLGIPVYDSAHEGRFFVRVKDSMSGTTYAPLCQSCPHFGNRKCQEGVYELTLTPDFRLKICRHRADIEYHVDPERFTRAEVTERLRAVLDEVYALSSLFTLSETA